MCDKTILEVNNICKSYDRFKLKNISFKVNNGDVVGLIGANGSGKSTTIKIILKIVEKDSGDIKFLGYSVLKDDNILYKENIGYVGENSDFFPNQRLKDVKNFYREYYCNWDEKTYNYLFNDVFELSENYKVKELSKGMKVKFYLTLALSHNPKLLIMDEPTSGLDPIVRSRILKILKEYAVKKNASIIFSSHITEDMNKIATKLVFLNNGEVLEECNIEELLNRNYAIDEYLETLIADKELKYEKDIF